MGKLAYGLVVGLGSALAGCGGGALTSKVVDTPQGSTTALGAPRGQTYSFESGRSSTGSGCSLPDRALRRDPDRIVRGAPKLGELALVRSVAKAPSDRPKRRRRGLRAIRLARDVEVRCSSQRHPNWHDRRSVSGPEHQRRLREKMFAWAVPQTAMVRERGFKGSRARIGRLSLASLRD